MENVNEISFSLNFASSSHVPNGSSSYNLLATRATGIEPAASIENLRLSKLCVNLGKLLIDSEYDYTDAEIVVEGIPVGVHRCILASQSHFFHDLFKKGTGNNNSSVKEGKPRYLMSELLPHGWVGYEAFNVFLYYLYTGELKPPPPEVSTCVDDNCVHDACGPAINYFLELMYASATFQMKDLLLLVERHLFNLVEMALAEDVIPILVAAFHCQLKQLLFRCNQRVAWSDLDNICLEKELPYEVFSEIKSMRCSSQEVAEPCLFDAEKIRKIHKALDSDDVALLKLLLSESNVSLDDAYALHFAAAYCDPKVVKGVLNLGLANLNLRNSRGHTVLHVAARRKELSVLVALLTKGACVSEATPDGQNALSICRRLISPKDYNDNRRGSNKNGLCIDVLEREMTNSISGNSSISSEVIAKKLNTKLDYLEDRVAFARLLFPAEAKVAMDATGAELSTIFYASLELSRSEGLSGNLGEVNMNKTPSVQTERLKLRLQTLIETVETGKRYFPHCSEVIDKFLEDYQHDDILLEKGTLEEQNIKKRRFQELKEEVQMAFYKDIEQNNRSPSSSSTSQKEARVAHKGRRK
ncbi:hypothetical protein SLE2022_365460 [Rubroshorea leprosula]